MNLLFTSLAVDTFTRIGQLTWAPTDEIDSEDAFLTDSPKNLIKINQIKDLPFISGFNTNEGLLITSGN